MRGGGGIGAPEERVKRRVGRAAALSVAHLIGSTVTAVAQGGPGGVRQAPDAMALLERPLSGVEGISNTQKDSLTKIETTYKAKFTTATTEMRTAIVAARQAGGTPDMAAMVRMRESMAATRQEEWSAVRGVLTPAQQPKFDENTKAMLADDAAREARMRQRMGGTPPLSPA